MDELVEAFNNLNLQEKTIIKNVIENNNDIDSVIESFNKIKIDNNNNPEVDKNKLNIAINMILSYSKILINKKKCVCIDTIKSPFLIY